MTHTAAPEPSPQKPSLKLMLVALLAALAAIAQALLRRPFRR